MDLDPEEVAKEAAKEAARLERIRAFYAKHGEAWTYIHLAGYVGEVWPGGLYEDQREAWKAVEKDYDRDEREAAKVDVAHWDAEGEFWSYDH